MDNKKKIQKAFHSNVSTKRRRAHKQDACEKRLVYENRTAEYASGIGLDIGAQKGKEETPKKQEQKEQKGRLTDAGQLIT